MGLVLFGGFSNRFVGEELFDLHIGHHTIVLTELFHDIPKQEHFDNQNGQRNNDAQRLEHVEVNVDKQADQRDYRAEDRPAQTVHRAGVNTLGTVLLDDKIGRASCRERVYVLV